MDSYKGIATHIVAAFSGCVATFLCLHWSGVDFHRNNSTAESAEVFRGGARHEKTPRHDKNISNPFLMGAASNSDMAHGDLFVSEIELRVTDQARTTPLESILWLLSDNDDARRFAFAYPFERRELVRKLFLGIPSQDYEKCFSLITTSGDAAAKVAAIEGSLDHQPPFLEPLQILANPNAYAVSIDDSKAVRETAIRHLASQDPEEARKYALGNDSPDDRDAAILTVAEINLSKDAPAAMEWALAHSTTSSKGAVFSFLFETWISSDPDRATQWMHDNPKHSMISEAVHALVARFSDTDPSVCREWVASIAEDSVRAEVEDLIDGKVEDAPDGK